MEIIMKRQLIGNVESFGLLNEFQSSTSTALIKITDDLLTTSGSKLTSVLALLDFSKAFDSVNHELVCAKLATLYGFTTCAVGLIRSYMSNRMQYIFANGKSSSLLPLTTGIVLGSVLGPILFSLFINDITSQITSCSYHLYADDVQLYKSCNPNDIELCINQINADLCGLYQWSRANGISINYSKSQAMIISPSQLTFVVPRIHLGDDEIACFPKLRNLSLIINQELKWNEHITKLCRSVLFTLRTLHRLPQQRRERS
jgi:ribonucleases P/MRP protein subunit RPP40